MLETVDLHCVVDGPEDAPAVFLAPSLGTSTAMWEPQVGGLAERYRVVRLDPRGHGRSPVLAGPYTMEAMAADVVALADRLGVERFAFVGLSMSGGIGQVLALDHVDRLWGLVLCCTASRFGDEPTWRQRAEQARRDGTASLVEATRERWFTDAFTEEEPETVARVMGLVAATSDEGYAGCCDALASFDCTDRLGGIKVPTRVVAGGADPGTTPEVCRALADAIPGADFVVVDGVAHIANVPRPPEFTAVLREHLDRHAP